MRAEFIKAIRAIEQANAEATLISASCISMRNSLSDDDDDDGGLVDGLLAREGKLRKIIDALYEARVEMKEYLEGDYK